MRVVSLYFYDISREKERGKIYGGGDIVCGHPRQARDSRASDRDISEYLLNEQVTIDAYFQKWPIVNVFEL